MDSSERLRWFGDNIEFFNSIDDEQLSLLVPTCPGWMVIDVLKHLSFGLGVCYPIAAATPPDSQAELVFQTADRSTVNAEGAEAVAAFRTNMANCLALLSELNPEAPCWTYAGPGTVSFWIQRAASETTIHRYDVERALGIQPALTPDRSADGIDEALEFALPFAATKVGAPKAALHLEATDSTLRRSIGEGTTDITFTGDSYDLLLQLWGREPTNKVQIDGDEQDATEWLTLVFRAFAGR